MDNDFRPIFAETISSVSVDVGNYDVDGAIFLHIPLQEQYVSLKEDNAYRKRLTIAYSNPHNRLKSIKNTSFPQVTS